MQRLKVKKTLEFYKTERQKERDTETGTDRETYKRYVEIQTKRDS